MVAVALGASARYTPAPTITTFPPIVAFNGLQHEALGDAQLNVVSNLLSVTTTGATLAQNELKVLEDGIAFAGVAKFPARVKCAMLGWMALRDALVRALTTTEDLTEETR